VILAKINAQIPLIFQKDKFLALVEEVYERGSSPKDWCFLLETILVRVWIDALVSHTWL
jgi:hypothetical protein